MLKSLLRLRPFIAPYRWRLSSGVAAFGLARLFEGLVPFFLAMGIDRIAAGNGDVRAPVLGIAAAVAARYVTVTGARYMVRTTGQRVAYDLRQRLYGDLQRQGARFFNRHSIGDMMTRAVADISLIQRLIAMGTILVIILAYATLVGFGFMLYFSPALTLLLLPPMPLIFYNAKRLSRQMGSASMDVQNRLSDLAAQTQENLAGIRTIQAMAQEENEIARFAATNESYAGAFYRQAQINSLMTAWMPTLAAACSITILGYGGYLVLTGEMTPGALVAFFMYVNMVVQPFRVAGFIVNLVQRGAVASDRLFEVFDLQAEVPDQPSGTAPAFIKGAIDIRALTLRHDAGREAALKGLSLAIHPGEMIAIMGRIGSGKTTLLKTLTRLFDPPPGTVFIDGVDVRDYPLGQLRAQVALVPQQAFLFGLPLKDNLSYDDPLRPIDQVWAAAAAADLKDTLEEFPEGMDTIVGERGVTLSGGQKQRATLARGLIREAPVLILDDCFSSVDTETEERILNGLKRSRSGRTTLIVSHRVSTARHANRILILDAGQIVEGGSHRELIKKDGLYAELERLQRGGEPISAPFGKPVSAWGTGASS
ncbi:MAG: ABC transporter ATP-binding protein [Gammaproteobacteria bacterium]|nr:ABC transporter ATP-binding protein [Gammaproteobacteria bacterium]MDE0273989.1 ABC transporter ATP-binding protein [Gammaproteobacteria bacterium]